MIEKCNQFRVLQAQYAAFITEQYVVTDEVISAATTARLEAIDLEMLEWDRLHIDEIRVFGGVEPSRPSRGQACHPLPA